MMKDDLDKTSLPALGIEDIEKMKTFWRFTIRKASAHVWAFRHIRFLVYDDTDDEVTKEDISKTEECPYNDSEDEEATLRRAIEMSLETENVSPDRSPQHTESEPSAPKGPSANHHGLSNKCDICANLPEFPHDRKARNFRIINPGSLDPTRSLERLRPCTHHVALSYCWPEPAFDQLGQLCQPPRESKVRDLNGIVRKARALDDVLDRAVDFANCAGLRMIWIDQECLPQPATDGPEEEKEYQQLGIQAMDIVYNQAIITAGLHSGTISNQTTADALGILMDLDDINAHEPLPRLDHLILDELYSFLCSVISDRWYTRAWIIQESISAGAKLVLSFRRGGGIDYPSSLRSPENPTKHSLHSQLHLHSSQLINITVNGFRGLLRVAKRLAEEQFQEWAITPHAAQGSFLSVLENAELLHPSPIAGKYPLAQCTIRGGNRYGLRPTVNASTSLTLLRSRQCREAQDKIAIVANMCNYDIRLNDRFIVKHCTSLRLAILTLALLNGDLSLLVPELYLPYHINEISNKWEACPTDGLLSPFDTNPGAIHDRTMLEKGPLNPRSYAHTLIGTATFGLPLPAYIWTIDRELDLSCLKEQLASYWHELKILRITVVPQEGESDFAFRARQNTAYQHISGKIDIQKKALQEIFQHGHVHKNSEVWSGVDPTGIRCTAELNVALIESDPAARQKLAGIIFVILAHLNRLARRDPGAAGVANSIWHSLRVDYIQGLEVKLPDMVCDDLFTHPGVLLDAFSTIQLHKGPDNSYLQTWFIDRIMRHGTLWIGRYTRVHESMISRRTSAFAFLPFEDQAIGKGSRGRSEVSDERQGSSSSGQPQSVSDRFREKDILDQQSGKETFAELSEIAMFHSFGSSGASKGINVGALVRLLDVRFRSIWTAEADEARAQELLSIFDVDGPCVIATPFNAEWETLPHSALRSMSTCWVVEELNRHAYGRVPVIEPLCVESKGKGKEKETLSNENPLPEKEGEPDENTPLYKVVAKVKGFWQLMGFPYGDVLFI